MKTRTQRVLFLTGGRSHEHEISLISTHCVLKALDRKRFTPLIVGIAKNGTWHWENEESFFRGEARADTIRLNTDAPEVSVAPGDAKRGVLRLMTQGETHEADVVFPVLHGPYGEDGTIQGMLDMLGIPYVGSGCGASWVCMDKGLTKTLCHAAGISVGDFYVVTERSQVEDLPPATRKWGTWFVKPSRAGSSVGVSKVTRWEDLSKALDTAFQVDSKCLIEKGIVGREIECAVLGNASPKASVPGEIVVNPKAGFYSYEAKYLMSDGAETLAKAPLSDSKRREIQDFVIKTFKTLECSGMARVDLFLDNQERISLNEVNTIPGFTPISMYPKMWEASGLGYSELISELIELATERFRESRA